MFKLKANADLDKLKDLGFKILTRELITYEDEFNYIMITYNVILLKEQPKLAQGFTHIPNIIKQLMDLDMIEFGENNE